MKKNLLNDNRAVRKYNMEVAVLKKVGDRTGCFFCSSSGLSIECICGRRQ